MISWSAKRQLAFLSIPFLLGCFILFLIYNKYFNAKPTCFDRIKNGQEEGVDCGGSCRLLCSASNLDPITLWSKAFPVTDNVYNLVSYIQNPNVNSRAINSKYIFKAYDDNDNLLGERVGFVSIPENKKIAVFEGGFKTIKTIKRVEFQFIDRLNWYKSDGESLWSDISIKNFPIEDQNSSPKIRGQLKNNSYKVIGNLELVALVFDPKENVVTASKTFVEKIGPNQLVDIIFTWPKPFPYIEEVCEINSNIMLVLDRSGSMQSISKNPPQPLGDVKKTATDFINSLKKGDHVGIVSFANEASFPIDHNLTNNFQSVKNAISVINIATTSLQNTNISDGLTKAFDELYLSSTTDRKNVIVLLTDGDPTDPKKTGDPKYPYTIAEEKAEFIKGNKVALYVIGLGDKVNEQFLQELSFDKYFKSPDTKTLNSIYSKISSDICKLKPNVISIIPNKVYNQ